MARLTCATLKHEVKPRIARKLVARVAIASWLVGTLLGISTVHGLKMPAPHAIGVSMQTREIGPGAASDAVDPRQAWYTPVQYQNQVTEIEPLPEQF